MSAGTSAGRRIGFFIRGRCRSRRLQKIGSGSRTRTYDPRINSPLLYQLSYAGVLAARRAADDSKASSTPSTWGQTEGGCGVFRESGGQAREQIGDRGVL